MKETEIKENSGLKRTLNTTALVSITFFCTAGGPYGLEPLVASASPFYVIMAVLFFPWIWSFPLALVTAELSNLFPDQDGMGFVMWIREAFGDFISFQAGYWSCLCNILDKAIYPVLFLDYLEVLVLKEDETFSSLQRWLIAVILVILVVYMNLKGMDLVGAASNVFFLLSVVPFIILCVLALPEVKPSLWLVTKGEVKWDLFISMLMWNNSGWDTVGALAAETICPQKTYPRAMFITTILVIFTYIIPIMVTICLDTNWSSWEDGDFETFAYEIGGTPLMLLFIIGAIVCSLGIFNALLSTSSRLMLSMSKMGMLPSIFGVVHKQWGTPWFSIIFNGVFISIMVIIPFRDLLEISVIVGAVVTSFIFISFIILRKKYPPSADRIGGGEEIFRIPMSTNVAAIYFCIPVLLCIYASWMSKLRTKILASMLVVVGTLLYLFCSRTKKTAGTDELRVRDVREAVL
eukprot:TRINITY_DN3862_c0_g1_i1.p1 TRINITY_DN3862_c0_g1~~TRINITY_DN3862_c0_g1_i1.p1  ORF type:complete len:463 (-),score=85.80 TRINITY_DN3862_c0_g1_i1:86-1474(-)